MEHKIPPSFAGLEHLSTAIILLNNQRHVVYANPGAEVLFAISAKQIAGLPVSQVFPGCDILDSAMEHAIKYHSPFREHEFPITTLRQQSFAVTCTVTPVELDPACLVLEFQHMDQQLRIAREERMLIQQQANAELLRNLAHEIRNPLGGLRGAAQLLEHELPQVSLREYTQVIIKEADRLQLLMDRLLVPHRVPKYEPTNIHEVLERVRSLLLAESPRGIQIRRDYDTSLPELIGDREKLIQAVLNIARNAVQAMLNNPGEQAPEIILRTRAARQVTLAKKRYRVAIKLQIIDNGPGIPPDIRERIFYPLVSGREGGTGLGLTLAQTFITQHHGMIECESEPGRTTFTILLPIESTAMKSYIARQ
ncbi:nitrogen regulation protein NR(II) [Methylobacillus flagellatus]|uniref:Sensory histidine kinase/phosphatase NtrB n=1 Tax=Methylobacillus flagellatus (strain ATCC 51484 / DSM 6875 / VKM B-1610 / KT) TaxID=265072 RepID=Q1GYH3_METFK|nr:nitrogen regulation protein NR(II) [Methylobacillus flagellatus]ABE50714.1 signal transduction histidine kinase, nitrogen specific, NtrB [Methylobacillus flagellatus KT]